MGPHGASCIALSAREALTLTERGIAARNAAFTLCDGPRNPPVNTITAAERERAETSARGRRLSD